MQECEKLTTEQRLYGKKYGAYVVQRAPLVFEYIQADVPNWIYIRVKTTSDETHHRRAVRITVRKLQSQLVSEAGVHLKIT